ncbi:MAG: hypothetical protein IPM89_16060 [Candidatus Competibacteraceae bacterium]|nr:MAG: hypothetical protein IPM89_16060 [Candidatus Competibacteraceae bacterium]
MSEQDFHRLVRVLEEIRDHQKLQLERQAEALGLQREQFALVRKQTERAERLQDRAEQIQAKSAQLVAGARKGMVVVLPILIVLIAYLTWLIFR